jgi:hypothetical protein
LNNNRGNNRRRGRGNNNNRQQGGGQQLNRIDSRARGNAPQLLEKYRKLAHDAHLNGDRVTEEYYLQFADHYFRVMADQRVRQEEQRRPRDERWQEDGGEGERERDDSEYGSDYGDGYTAYDQPHRREREERQPRRDEQPQQAREEREPEALDEQAGDDNRENAGDDASGQPAVYEPVENPFVRENRGTRGLRPRREDRGPRREPKSKSDSPHGDDANDDAPAGLDPSMLPPAISAGREEVATEDAAEAKPRRRTRRPRPPADDAGETLEAVS